MVPTDTPTPPHSAKDSKTAFLFPGQGSQAIGMCKDLYDEFHPVREIFETAQDITNIDITGLCFKGPIETLTQTANLQPAITAANIACLAALNTVHPDPPDICAGHSLGEYTALYQAGIISLEDTFRLVQKRGEFMQREAEKYPGKMSAVLKLRPETVREIVEALGNEGIITVANYNTPSQIVISGTPELLDKAADKVSQAGGATVPLKVSGAWHSGLIGGAKDEFAAFLDTVSFSAPTIPVIFNVTAGPENDPVKIKSIMAAQFCSPVRWSDTMQQMQSYRVRTFFEIGPGRVLTGLVKKNLPRDYARTLHNVFDLKTLAALG